jgi:hypothetical protein
MKHFPDKMKRILIFTATVGTCAVLGAGCMSALTEHASPEFQPVAAGYATTNDTQVTAVLREIQGLNSGLNPTSTRLPIDTAIGALIGLSSAASGWLARHKSGPKV